MYVTLQIDRIDRITSVQATGTHTLSPNGVATLLYCLTIVPSLGLSIFLIKLPRSLITDCPCFLTAPNPERMRAFCEAFPKSAVRTQPVTSPSWTCSGAPPPPPLQFPLPVGHLIPTGRPGDLQVKGIDTCVRVDGIITSLLSLLEKH